MNLNLFCFELHDRGLNNVIIIELIITDKQGKGLGTVMDNCD